MGKKASLNNRRICQFQHGTG